MRERLSESVSMSWTATLERFMGRDWREARPLVRYCNGLERWRKENMVDGWMME